MLQNKKDTLKGKGISMQDKFNKYIFLLGFIPVIWVSMLIAPSLDGGLKQIIKGFSKIMEKTVP